MFSSKYSNPSDVNSALINKYPSLLVFSADWCGPCQNYYNSASMQAIKEWCNVHSINFFYLNIDEFPELRESCQISSIPAISLFNRSGKFLLSLNAKLVTPDMLEDVFCNNI